jgi:uncharacterized protein (DUF1786 family)
MYLFSSSLYSIIDKEKQVLDTLNDLKSLALDIGAGTMDILLYDDQDLIENCIKMIVPSPTRFYANEVLYHTKKGNDIAIRGFTIGGGQLTFAIRNHVSKNKVYMTSNAAYSLRNDLDEVIEIGVKIIDDNHVFGGVNIFLNEIKLNQIEVFLNSFGETLMDVVLVAISVKDHGASPKSVSNREFRMKTFEKGLNKDPNLKKFLLRDEEIPGNYYRMRSNVQASKSFLPETDVVVMDTSPSAIMGCLMDPNVMNKSPVLAVNIGNGHTMAAVITDNKLNGLFEHHTLTCCNAGEVRRKTVNLRGGF